MAETEAEKKGLIDRNNLLSIQGRSRKPQMELAKEYGITVYPSPAGGCLLTCEEYAKKLRPLRTQETRDHGGCGVAADRQALPVGHQKLMLEETKPKTTS